MADRPNVILITSHDTGRHFGCYGAAGAPSPHIDALAGEGARLANCFCTQPQCSPSRASIATGRHPHSHGVMGLSHAAFRWDLHDDEQPIGVLLKAAGYRTALCGLQHETPRPERLGFDVMTGKAAAAEVAAACERQLADFATSGDPFYMQVGFTETHRDGSNDRQFHGYEPVDVDDVRVPAWLKDEPAARVELANLGGSLRALDDAVGRIVAAVDKHGLTGETLIVFTVDHGLPFPRAKTACYDPGIEVATIFRGPGVAAGTGVDGLTSNVDLLPTILDIAGLPIPQQVQGRSLAGPLRGGSNPGAVDAIFAEMTYHNYVDPIRAIRTATHKLIVNFMPTAGFYNCTQQWRPRTQASVDVAEPAGMHPLVEVYDLDADALEHHNLADDPQHAAVREQLLKRLREHLHSTGDPLLEGLPLPVRFSEAQALLRAAEG